MGGGMTYFPPKLYTLSLETNFHCFSFPLIHCTNSDAFLGDFWQDILSTCIRNSRLSWWEKEQIPPPHSIPNPSMGNFSCPTRTQFFLQGWVSVGIAYLLFCKFLGWTLLLPPPPLYAVVHTYLRLANRLVEKMVILAPVDGKVLLQGANKRSKNLNLHLPRDQLQGPKLPFFQPA